MFPQRARAHSDTMNGPVVPAAQAALEQKDVAPVLEWFVAAHVEYVHYVGGLHQAAKAAGAHHEAGRAAGPAEAATHEPAPEHQH